MSGRRQRIKYRQRILPAGAGFFAAIFQNKQESARKTRIVKGEPSRKSHNPLRALQDKGGSLFRGRWRQGSSAFSASAPQTARAARTAQGLSEVRFKTQSPVRGRKRVLVATMGLVRRDVFKTQSPVRGRRAGEGGNALCFIARAFLWRAREKAGQTSVWPVFFCRRGGGGAACRAIFFRVKPLRALPARSLPPAVLYGIFMREPGFLRRGRLCVGCGAAAEENFLWVE